MSNLHKVTGSAVPLSTPGPVQARRTPLLSYVCTQSGALATPPSLWAKLMHSSMHTGSSRTPGTVAKLKRAAAKPYAKDQTNHLCQVYTSRAPFQQRSVTVIVVALFLRRLRELLLPSCVRLRGVDVREDKVEDLRIPRDGLAFDAFFDVL